MHYTVRVTFTYPVQAVDAKDALSTVRQVIKMRYIGVHAQGLAEIIDLATGTTVLTAVLNPDKKSKQ